LLKESRAAEMEELKSVESHLRWVMIGERTLKPNMKKMASSKLQPLWSLDMMKRRTSFLRRRWSSESDLKSELKMRVSVLRRRCMEPRVERERVRVMWCGTRRRPNEKPRPSRKLEEQVFERERSSLSRRTL